MNWLKWIVDKLSRKTTPELTIDDYDTPVRFQPKHKFMDGNPRQRLTTKAWKHADNSGE
jgi:hypothetical protein